MGSLTGPLAVADGVTEIDLLVRAAGEGKIYVHLRLSVDDLTAWGERRLTDSDLLEQSRPIK
jgi:hypothetical protein